MLNSRNPFAKVTKHLSPKKTYLSGWNSVIKYCHTCYQWKIKDKLLIEGHHKTVIWESTFSIHSLVWIVEDYLSCECCPLEYILIYKYSQDHTELLVNIICHRYGWNNPFLQFMYALRRLFIRNSIEPSNTGNCTHFDDALCEPNGLFDFPSKWKTQLITMTMERILVIKEC